MRNIKIDLNALAEHFRRETALGVEAILAKRAAAENEDRQYESFKPDQIQLSFDLSEDTVVQYA